MKTIASRILKLIPGLLVIFFLLPGCYETHYYNHYHHHSRPWYEHHHRQPPAEINFDIDVYKRR